MGSTFSQWPTSKEMLLVSCIHFLLMSISIPSFNTQLQGSSDGLHFRILGILRAFAARLGVLRHTTLWTEKQLGSQPLQCLDSSDNIICTNTVNLLCEVYTNSFYSSREPQLVCFFSSNCCICFDISCTY